MFAKRGLLSSLAICFGCSMLAQVALADGPKGTSIIKGKVVFGGAPKKPKPIKMNAVAACAAMNKKAVPDQGTVIYTKQGNAVPFVFVYVKKGIKGKYDPPAEPVVIDQKGCMYTPHVFGMIAGQGMDIKNSDPTNHNIHSLAKKNRQFNFGQPQQNMIKKLRGKGSFTRPEVMVRIKCDVHSWMSTYCGVMTHPFFDVTKSHFDTTNKDERGTFAINELPAGDYELEAWHEKFGKITKKVTVGDGETKEVEFVIGGNASLPTSARTVELAANQSQKAPPACCAKKKNTADPETKSVGAAAE